MQHYKSILTIQLVHTTCTTGSLRTDSVEFLPTKKYIYFPFFVPFIWALWATLWYCEMLTDLINRFRWNSFKRWKVLFMTSSCDVIGYLYSSFRADWFILLLSGVAAWIVNAFANVFIWRLCSLIHIWNFLLLWSWTISSLTITRTIWSIILS